MVLFFFTQAKCFHCLNQCPVNVATIQMQMASIDQHRSGTTLMMMKRINLIGLLKESQRFLAYLKKSCMLDASSLARI